ncbi:MAG TPA: MFS transporter [Devosia sp.]|nr:MFS transporter [Devosia sp.]
MKSGSWASIIGVYLFGVCGGSTVSKIIPLAGDLTRVFDLSPTEFGWLISFIALPAALLAIPSGIVVDRYGPRRVLIAAAFCGVIADLIYLFGQSMAVFQAARLLEGVAIVHFYTAGPALLMGTTEGRRRTQAMTLWATYMPVGTSTGLLLGGLFAGSEAWRMSFMVHGSLVAVAGALAFLQPRIDKAAAGPVVGLGARILDLRGAYSRPMLLLLGFAFFLMISMGLGANITFPDYFARVHEITTASASSMVALTTLAMVPGSILAGVLMSSGRKPHHVFAVLGVIGFIVGSLSFVPGFGISVRYLVVTLWFVASGAAIAVLLATLPIVAEPHRRGAAAALINQAGAVATFANPPLWRNILAGGEWTPFVILFAVGWSLAIASLWFAAVFAARRVGAQSDLGTA